MPVLVLETLAVHGRAPRRAAHQEATCPRVGRLPDEVADTLEAEHRVEEVDRQHRQGPGRVRGPSRLEARHGAGLGYALLQDLSCAILRVGEQQPGVDGLVELALRGVDLRPPRRGRRARRCAPRRARWGRHTCRCRGPGAGCATASRTPSSSRRAGRASRGRTRRRSPAPPRARPDSPRPRTTRLGRWPPSARLRAVRYSCTGDPTAGR